MQTGYCASHEQVVGNVVGSFGGAGFRYVKWGFESDFVIGLAPCTTPIILYICL